MNLVCHCFARFQGKQTLNSLFQIRLGLHLPEGEAEDRPPADEPPEIPRVVKEQENDSEKRPADEGAEDEALQEVLDPERVSHAVEAESFLDAEIGIPRKGEGEHIPRQGHEAEEEESG